MERTRKDSHTNPERLAERELVEAERREAIFHCCYERAQGAQR